VSDLVTPAALLLDFGGVLVQTTTRPDWRLRLAEHVHRLLTTAGGTELTVEQVAADIGAGAAADSHWKDAMSRPAAPAEMTQRFFWAELVAADWPDAARTVVATESAALCRRMGELRQERVNRPGIERLLGLARDRSIPVAVVSNALCGVVHRDHLAATGLAELIAVQVYSDEIGVRKPNPALIEHAARALSVPTGAVWYVGDTYDRDVVCGHRAGAGATILMRSRSTDSCPYEPRFAPDAVVDDPDALRALLTATDSVH
jgi:HAD superfamily hydrolase (TIGR01549 family)